jgi:regulator of sigma E protease
MTFETVLSSLGDGAWTVAFFLIAIMIIVFVHEFGHYIVGRWSGIHAEVFSLGFGKVIYSRTDRHGTRWQLAMVPLGGYVKFLGDANASSANPDEETLSRLSNAERRHTLHGAPLWARAVTVLAGPMFNVLLTMTVFAAMIAIWGILDQGGKPVVDKLRALPGQQQTLLPGDQILAIDGVETADIAAFYKVVGELAVADSVEYSVLRDGAEVTLAGPYPLPAIAGSVMSKSAAMDAGILAGDVILAVDGKPVQSFAQIPPMVAASKGTAVSLSVWRSGETFELTLTPRRRDLPTEDGGFETRWLIGLTSALPVDLATHRPGVLETLSLSWTNTVRVADSSLNGMLAIVKGQISSCNISGAITMAVVMGDAAKVGWESFLGMLAVLSLGIGLLNLMPVPVLDGGHLVFHAWEALTGKPPSNKALGRMTMVGLGLILALMVYALRNDLVCV